MHAVPRRNWIQSTLARFPVCARPDTVKVPSARTMLQWQQSQRQRRAGVLFWNLARCVNAVRITNEVELTCIHPAGSGGIRDYQDSEQPGVKRLIVVQYIATYVASKVLCELGSVPDSAN